MWAFSCWWYCSRILISALVLAWRHKKEKHIEKKQQHLDFCWWHIKYTDWWNQCYLSGKECATATLLGKLSRVEICHLETAKWDDFRWRRCLRLLMSFHFVSVWTILTIRCACCFFCRERFEQWNFRDLQLKKNETCDLAQVLQSGAVGQLGAMLRRTRRWMVCVC